MHILPSFLRPSLLARTLTRGVLTLVLPALLLGVGLYLLTDLFEKLDNFMEAGLDVGTVLLFFAYKTPSIISQLLPVIFLLAVVIQLCLMTRNRELMALQAGGISLLQPARILLLCGIAAAGTQLCFSEVLGVIGDRESSLIWQEKVRHKDLANAVVENVWFRDEAYIVNLGTLDAHGGGRHFTGYELERNNVTIRRIIQADRFEGGHGEWTLRDVTVSLPQRFKTTRHDEMRLPISRDPGHFRLFTTVTAPSQLPLWQLGAMIEYLSASGSNVEHLRTAWHNKLSYACSLIVMALIGVALVSFTDNVYLATVLALLCTFLYFMLFTVFTSIGERGALPPAVAAWMADIVGLTCTSLRLVPLFFGQRK